MNGSITNSCFALFPPFKKPRTVLFFILLKAPVKDSALEDLIWFHSYKSRATHQLKSISSSKRKEEHPPLTQTLCLQNSASAEPFFPRTPCWGRALPDNSSSDPRDQSGDDKRTDKEENGVCRAGDSCVTRAAPWVRCG